MADSQSLRLVFASASLHDHFAEYVTEYLRLQGFDAISPSILNFLSALDCGINYSAEIARRLKVSRQMVAKTVKELCRAGYLEQIEGVGQQKQILLTEQGERLISTVRLALADLDQIFIGSFGDAHVEEVALQLEAFKFVLMTLQAQG
jgi:DNA-binding MarR family transcriptional regulator